MTDLHRPRLRTLIVLAATAAWPAASCSEPSTHAREGTAEREPEPEPVAPPRPTPPSPEAQRRLPFECARAPEVIGLRAWEVELCQAYPGMPALHHVTLLGPNQERHGALIALDEAGRVITERGAPVAGRFLRRVGAVEDASINPHLITLALSALDGFPEPFEIDDADYSRPGVGEGGVETGPLRVVLIRAMVEIEGNQDPISSPHQRATLHVGDSGRLQWTIDRGLPWRPLTTVEAE